MGRDELDAEVPEPIKRDEIRELAQERETFTNPVRMQAGVRSETEG